MALQIQEWRPGYNVQFLPIEIEPMDGAIREVKTTIKTITVDNQRADDTRNEILKMIHLESQSNLKNNIWNSQNGMIHNFIIL